MKNPFESILENRTTTGKFDSEFRVSRAVVEKLIYLATKAPSAFNLQNWRFIAAQSAEAKAKLRAVAYNQKQVEDASVCFIVCGELDGYRYLSDRLQPAVDQGILTRDTQRVWADMATGTHAANPQLQRDEAFRSASLVAMNLMLAANSLGLASGALSGFDPEALCEAFSLKDSYVPVVLITVGQASSGNWLPKPRRPVRDVLEVV